MTIRPAREEEFPPVLALWREARSATASLEDTEESLRRLAEWSGDALLVAEADGEIVGALIAAWDGWRGNRYRLAVRPEYRRRGIGRALVEAGDERLRAHGARRVTALVAREEAAAAGLWRTAGYEEDEFVVRYVRNL